MITITIIIASVNKIMTTTKIIIKFITMIQIITVSATRITMIAIIIANGAVCWVGQSV